MGLINRCGAAVLLCGVALLGSCGEGGGKAMVASAKDFLAKSAPKEAIIQLKNALQQEPDLGEARYLLGKALLEDGDPKSAVIELGKAQALQVSPELTAPVLARAWLAQGEHHKLLDTLALLDLSDRAAAADLKTSVAIAHFAVDQKARGEVALGVALTLKPDHVPARLLQIRRAAASGDLTGALGSVQATVKQSPADASAWLLQAQLQAASRGDAGKALASYRKALELGRHRLSAHTGILAIVLAQQNLDAAQAQIEAMRRDLPNHPQTDYFEALLALQRKDVGTARRLTDKLLAAVPASPLYQALAGAVAAQSEDLPKAETLLASAVQALPASRSLRRQLAQVHVRNGKPAQALSLLRPMLEKGAPDAEAMTLAAVAHLQAGDARQAQALFSAVGKLKPADLRTRTSVALGQLGGGDADAALGELQGIAAADTGIAADVALIAARIQRRELDAALKAIELLEHKQPDHPIAMMLRAKVQLLRGQDDAARGSYERALALSPRYFPAYAALAESDLARHKPELAAKRFESLLAIDPNNASAMMALAVVREKAGAPPAEVATQLANAVRASPADASARLLLIEHHLKLGDHRQALSAAQDGVNTLPASAALLAALGRSAGAMGDWNQAIKAFTQLVALQDRSPESWLLLARAQRAVKADDGARQSYAKALSLKPDHAPAVQELMGLELAQGHPQAAMALARRLQTSRPADAVGYVLQARVHAHQKQWVDAEAAYRAALKRAVNQSAVVRDLHALLRVANKPREADRLATSWLRDHPEDLLFWIYLGEEAMVRQDFAAAQVHYLSALRVAPRDARVLNNLAWVTLKLGKPGALTYAERAVALQPQSAAYVDTLAAALVQDKQLDKALAAQKRALELAPNDALLRLNLARLYLRSGDKGLAREQLDRLAALGDRFAGQAQVAELRRAL